MKNDDAALVKEMKSGPPRKKKVESAGGVENRRAATKGRVREATDSGAAEWRKGS
jgi:hypothetical protein